MDLKQFEELAREMGIYHAENLGDTGTLYSRSKSTLERIAKENGYSTYDVIQEGGYYTLAVDIDEEEPSDDGFPVYVVYEADEEGNTHYVKVTDMEGLVCAGMGFDGRQFSIEKEVPADGIDCTE